MCVTAIANLQQQHQKKGKLKYLFDKDTDLIPYMEQYWESMTTMPRRVTQSWQVFCDCFRFFFYFRLLTNIDTHIRIKMHFLFQLGHLTETRCYLYFVSYFRYSTVQKTLLKDNAVFTFEDGLEGQQMFGLVTNDLTQIKPNYEAMVKGGTLRVNDEGYAQGNLYLLCMLKIR